VRTIAFELEPSFDSSGTSEPTLVIRLSVGLDFALDMLPYPTARRSVVTRPLFQTAINLMGNEARRGNGVLLSRLLILGQPVSDLIVYPSVAPSRLQVDGFLGLDFFAQFDLVEWRPKSRQMRLTID
jgi:hypothetical protein